MFYYYVNEIPTFNVGSVVVSPAALHRAFGVPKVASTDPKVSREYAFLNEQGIKLTIYDYKATSLYSPLLPSSTDFWASEEPFEFEIGGYCNNENAVLELKACIKECK